MKRIYSKLIWIFVFMLLCSGISGCSWEEMERFLSQDELEESVEN